MQRLLYRLYRKSRNLANKLRIWKWRLLGAHIGPGVVTYGRFIVGGNPRNLTIGRGSGLNECVVLNCRDRLTLGEDVQLSGFVQIHTGSLYPDHAPREHYSKPVVIEDHVWLASNVVILPGVTVGKGACVAAGSIVREDVKPGWLYGGVPAKPIRPLDPSRATKP